MGREIKKNLADGNEYLAFLDVGSTLVEARQKPSGWSQIRIWRSLGGIQIRSSLLRSRLFLTTTSAFPQATILLNIVRISSFSSNLAGLDMGPTRIK